jgi:hypothetical protein
MVFMGLVKWDIYGEKWIRCGRGVELWSDLSIFYDGLWDGNEKNGPGTFYWRNGVVMYTGMVKNGKYHGYGMKYDYRCGTSQCGLWKAGALVSQEEDNLKILEQFEVNFKSECGGRDEKIARFVVGLDD